MRRPARRWTSSYPRGRRSRRSSTRTRTPPSARERILANGYSRAVPRQRREPQRRQPFRKQARAFVDLWIDLFRQHQILAYASGIAFRTLVALIPLLLLGFAVLGALHRSDVWTHQMSPAVAGKVTHPVFAA